MRDHSQGWRQNRRRERRSMAIEAVMLFVALVGLIAVGQIGWDCIEHMPSTDMGAW